MFKYVLIFCLLSNVAFSQCMEKPEGNEKIAENYVSFGQYECALGEYLMVYIKKPDDQDLNLRIAQCYLGIPGSAPKAIKYLEMLLSQKKINPNARWMSTIAYMQNYEFDKAIEQANKYKIENPSKTAEIKELDNIILSCNNAKQLIKIPFNFRIENLGKDVNSKFEDYNPISTDNEDQILFSTTRMGTTGGFSIGNGFVSDVYLTNFKSGKYSKARSLGTTFNTVDIDEIAGSSADLNYLFVATDADGVQILKLKMSKMAGKAGTYPKPTDVIGINETVSNVRSATINNEGNIIIFASDRLGGLGAYDLYISRILPDGTWGIPVNLGKGINTEKDELFPQFNHEQTGISFSSDGQFNMGGLDLFESFFNEDFTQWSTPRNYGHPINTPFDDLRISFIPGNRLAYKSDYRSDSYGMSDLYRFVFLDSTPQFTVLNAKVTGDEIFKLKLDSLKSNQVKNIFLKDSLSSILANGENPTIKLKLNNLTNLINVLDQKIKSLEPNYFAEISVTNVLTNTIYGEYKSNTNKGGVIMILEPGKYELSINAEGFYPSTKTIEILDKSSFVPFAVKDFILKKK